MGDVLLINSEDGDRWLLADSIDDALAWAREDSGTECELKSAGWMQNVGWDRFNYALKREFVEDTGFDSWWEQCPAPEDGNPTRKVKQAFSYVYLPTVTLGSFQPSPEA